MTVLAVAEHRRGELRDVSLEVLTAGRHLADATGGDLHVAVISGDVDTLAGALDRDGVDTIHTVAYGEEFNHDVYTQATTHLVDAIDPTYLLAPNSVNGLDYVPAVAHHLEWPLVTDAVAIDASDGLTVIRELYAGKTEGQLAIDGDRAAITIRAGEWPAATGIGSATIQSHDPAVDESAIGSTVTGFAEVGAGDVDITDADVLVSVGRGIQEEDNLDLIFELAEALDATVSASRPIVDSGWLEQDRQVGQSGKVVTPDLYLAIGISGAVQHVAGMKEADTIVAINTDPNAPIFDIADYGVVDDLFDVVPALIDHLQG